MDEPEPKFAATLADSSFNIVLSIREDGVTFETNDACGAVGLASEKTVREKYPAVLSGLIALCDRQKKKAGEALLPRPQPKPAKPAQPQPVVEKPPTAPDDGEQQDAPSAEVEADVDRNGPAAPGEQIGDVPPTDAVFDQAQPVEPAALAEQSSEQLAQEQPDGELDASAVEQVIDLWLRNAPATGQSHPTHSGERARHPVSGSDPVDLFTGLLTIDVVDLEVQSPYLPMQLIRTYQSGRPYYGPWGFGWDHNYNAYLRELDDGGVARWTGRLHEDTFALVGDAFEPPRGVHERLERVDGQPQQYLLTVPGGTTCLFARPPDWTDAERIPLVTISDRHGNTQYLQYDQSNRLDRVIDDDARALIFHYGQCGLLEEVGDHAGRQVRYDHHPEIEHLVCVVTPPTASYPDGACTSYEYDRFADHPAMRHNLLRVTDADGATYLQNEYGGPQEGWAFNRVTRQLFCDWCYEISYDQIQFVPPDPDFVDYPALRTTVRQPDGSTHTHTFNYRGDLIDYRFRLTVDGSYRIVSRQWSYDAQGNVTSLTGPDGSRTVHVYDADSPDPCARGNLLTTELVAALPLTALSRLVFAASYEPRFQLPVEIVDERQAVTHLTYDLDEAPGPAATGRLAEIAWPAATLPNGSTQTGTTRFETDARGQITAVISPEEIRTELAYHLSGTPLGGLLATETVSGGALVAQTIREYDAFGFIRRLTDPLGVSSDSIYDASGCLEELRLPEVSGIVDVLRYRYNAHGVIRSIEEPRGTYADGVIAEPWLRHQQEVNPANQVILAVEGANTQWPRVTRFSLDHAGRAVKEVDAAGTVTLRTFDERGLLLEETDGAGTSAASLTRRIYDRDGRLVKSIAPGERVTELEYDPWGRPSHVTLPNGTVVHTEWGPGDLVLTRTFVGDPGDGGPPRTLASTSFDYDERGRLRSTTEASFVDDVSQAVPLTTTYWYDRENRTVRQVGPRDETWQIIYDPLGRLARVEDPLGNAIVTGFDLSDRVTTVTHEEIEGVTTRSRTMQYTYDDRDRLVAATGPGGATVVTVYDARDLGVEQIDQRGVHTQHSYGLLDELVRTTVDPGGLHLIYEQQCDLLGRVMLLRDPTQEETTIGRDPLGRVAGVMLEDNAAWTYGYSPAGDLINVALPGGGLATLTYDDAGRLVQLTTVPGPNQLPVPAHHYAYDGLDRLTTATAGPRTVTRGYDSLGRLRREQTDAGVITRNFDDLAGLVLLTHPNGVQEAQQLDLLGRVSTMLMGQPAGPLAPVLDVEYAGSGRVHELKYANGTVARWRYDDASRLIRLEHEDAQGASLESTRYRYDAGNRRRVVQHTAEPSRSVTHALDDRNRLIRSAWGFPLAALPDTDAQSGQDAEIAGATLAATGADQSESYALDGADTPITATSASGPTSTTLSYQSAAGHRVVAVGSEVIAYWHDGHRAVDGERRYDVDALGRWVATRDAATHAPLVDVVYDPLGRVSGGVRGGEPFHHLAFDGGWVAESDANGDVTRLRLLHPALSTPVAMMTPSGLHFLHADGHADLVLATDASGAAVERYRYAPFGMPTIFDPTGQQPRPTSTIGVEPIFGGTPFWHEMGLFVTPGRLYDPRFGLFTGRDSMLYSTSASPYVLAHHDPVNFADPGGDIPVLVLVGLAALTGGVIGALVSGDGPGAFNQGGGTLLAGGGTLALGIVLAATPVGWIGALSAALMIAGGAVGTGVGAAQSVMSMSGQTSPSQNRELNRVINTTMSLSSPLGLPGGMAGLVLTGEERGLEAGANYGNFLEAGGSFASGVGPMLVREVRFGLPRVGALRGSRKFRFLGVPIGSVHRGKRTWFRLRYSTEYGTVRPDIRRVYYNAGGERALTRPDPRIPGGDVLEMSHTWSDASIGTSTWRKALGHRPWNLTPKWRMEHALADTSKKLGGGLDAAIALSRPTGELAGALHRAAPWMVRAGHGTAHGMAIGLRRVLVDEPETPSALRRLHLPELFGGERPGKP